tara:strand:+ start:13677 stop:13973 length:297 start_codon:yes stop_codon:yes gene_type:complete
MGNFIVIGIKGYNDLYYKVSFNKFVEVHKKQLIDAISYNLGIFIEEEMKKNRNDLAESFYYLGQFLKNEYFFDWRNCSLKTFNGKQTGSIQDFIIDLK